MGTVTHCMHQPAPGIDNLTAPQQYCRVTASKQRSASGATDDNLPISSWRGLTRLACSRQARFLNQLQPPSASDISCIFSFQGIGQAGIKRGIACSGASAGARRRQATDPEN